jgi:hypothetical protein
MLDVELAGECVQLLTRCAPPPPIRQLHVLPLAARRELGVTMRDARVPGCMHLDAAAVALAVEYYAPLRLVFTAGVTGIAKADLVTAVETVASKLRVGSGSLRLADFIVLSRSVTSISERFDSTVRGIAGSLEPRETSLVARMASVLTVLEGRGSSRDAGASRDDGGQRTTERVTGYAKHHAAFLIRHFETAAFVELVGGLESMIGQVGTDAETGTVHAHDVVGLVCASREPTLQHALFGLKDEIGGLPVAKVLCSIFRAHGPSFLGQRAFETVLPAEVIEHDEFVYPSLKSMWLKLCKGNLLFSMEDEWILPTLRFYGDTSAKASAAGQQYRCLAANRQILRCSEGGQGPFALLGYDEEPSFATVMRETINYVDEAFTIPLEERLDNGQAHIVGVLRERSELLMRGFEAGDATTCFGGALVVQGSPARAAFNSQRVAAARTFKLARDLRTLGVTATFCPSVGAEDGRSGGGRGAAALAQVAAAALAQVPATALAAPPVAAGGAAVVTGGRDDAAAKAAKVAERTAKADADRARQLAASADQGSPLIGSRSEQVKICEEENYIQFYTHENKPSERFKLREARAAVAAVVPDGCLETFLSRAKFPAIFCSGCKRGTPEEKARHATKGTRAHAVPSDWRNLNLRALLVTTMVAGATTCHVAPGNASMPMGPLLPDDFGMGCGAFAYRAPPPPFPAALCAASFASPPQPVGWLMGLQCALGNARSGSAGVARASPWLGGAPSAGFPGQNADMALLSATPQERNAQLPDARFPPPPLVQWGLGRRRCLMAMP